MYGAVPTYKNEFEVYKGWHSFLLENSFDTTSKGCNVYKLKQIMVINAY